MAATSETERSFHEMEEEREKEKSDKNCSLWKYTLLANFFSLAGLAGMTVTIWNTMNGDIKLHPILLTIGFVNLYSNGIIGFRFLLCCSKTAVKIIHAIVQLLAFACTVTGLYFVWGPGLNLTSPHSWIGFTTAILFFLQWVAGFVTFLFPGLSGNLRGSYKPHHVFWGLTIYIMAIAAILTGLVDWAPKVDGYSTRSGYALVLNSTALLIMASPIVVVYMTTRSELVRPSDEELQGGKRLSSSIKEQDNAGYASIN